MAAARVADTRGGTGYEGRVAATAPVKAKVRQFQGGKDSADDEGENGFAADTGQRQRALALVGQSLQQPFTVGLLEEQQVGLASGQRETGSQQ